MLGLRCCAGFFLVAVSRVCSPVAGQELLIVVTSLAAKHGYEGTWALVVVECRLRSCGSGALEPRLNNCCAGA